MLIELLQILQLLCIIFEVSEMAVSELPGNPNAVWTVKKTSAGNNDNYIN